MPVVPAVVRYRQDCRYRYRRDSAVASIIDKLDYRISVLADEQVNGLADQRVIEALGGKPPNPSQMYIITIIHAHRYYKNTPLSTARQSHGQIRHVRIWRLRAGVVMVLMMIIQQTKTDDAGE